MSINLKSVFSLVLINDFLTSKSIIRDSGKSKKAKALTYIQVHSTSLCMFCQMNMSELEFSFFLLFCREVIKIYISPYIVLPQSKLCVCLCVCVGEHHGHILIKLTFFDLITLIKTALRPVIV